MIERDASDEPIETDTDYARWQDALESGVFEEAFAALEDVVARLEQGRLRLADTLSCYELGVRLAERCGRILAEADLRVTRLDASLGEVAAWDDPAEGDEIG